MEGTGRAPHQVKNVIVVAPYSQNETSLYACAVSSFLQRKLKGIKTWDFKYLTLDPLSQYYSPLVDSYVHRIISPSDFEFHLGKCKTIYWFDTYNKYIQRSRQFKNYLFADHTKWDNSKIKLSKCYSSVLFPSDSITSRMFTLISCYSNPTIYPGSFMSMSHPRQDILNRRRLKVILSMCGIRKVENRLAILRNLEKLVKDREDIFVTLLMDGRPFADERQLIVRLGIEYSDKCLILNNFSDYEYSNILQENDLFIDLNPINGVGYLLTAALQQGLLVGGFDQPLYRDILQGGDFGMLFQGQRKEYGYQFERVVPNWDNVFRLLNDRVFTVPTILRFIDKRNDCPNFMSTMEARLSSFLDMFHYIINSKLKHYSFAE